MATIKTSKGGKRLASPKKTSTKTKVKTIYRNKGGENVNIEPLSVTKNGSYLAPDGIAYSPVNVNITGDDIDKLVQIEGVDYYGQYCWLMVGDENIKVGDKVLGIAYEGVNPYWSLRIRKTKVKSIEENNIYFEDEVGNIGTINPFTK